MKAIQLYAKHLIRSKAHAEILADLKDQVLRELQRTEKGKAISCGVEFHLTKKITRKYAKDIADILKDLKAQEEQQKKLAEESGKFREKETPTFDASIPKSTEEKILAGVPDYKKHFGIKS
jgi:uncharacterized membrane-anchored protein YjiN (DUF445 family)